MAKPGLDAEHSEDPGGMSILLQVQPERLKESSGTGFSTATELADSLVRITGMPFRTAHRIVGRIAAGKECA